MRASPVELLSALIRFESLSHHEDEAAAFMTQILGVNGVTVRRIENNVVASIGDGDRALLLNSHLDVVPPSTDHPYPPFEPTVHEGRLYGRGSVDAKASVATMAVAFLRLNAEGWQPPGGHQLVAAFTACEEVGGGYNGLEAVRPSLPKLVAALIGEPTELAPCTAQKGMMILEATARGVTAHAARPQLGLNAIDLAARDIVRIAEHRFIRKHELLGSTIANVTIVGGGTTHNVIPDACEFTIDIRMTPAYKTSEVQGILDDMIESSIRVRSDRYAPVETAGSEQIVQAAIDASGKTPFGSATASDWVYVADVPTVKIGPGDSNLSHTATESIALTEVERAPGVYAEIVRRYFAA